MKAIWNGEVIAESSETIVVEGNHYFPPSSISQKFYQPSNHRTKCPWKGTASYYTLAVNGKENKDAAWYYAEPFEKANHIKDYVAFWKGVKIEA